MPRPCWTESAGCSGVQEFAATPAGYARLLGWLQGFGTVGLVGIEGTGSYGAGLARHIAGDDLGNRNDPEAGLPRQDAECRIAAGLFVVGVKDTPDVRSRS